MTTAPLSRESHVCQHPHTVVQATAARFILIAGADAGSMEEVATPIFRAGHVPLIGHWSAADDMVGLGRARGVRVLFSLQDALDG